MLTPAAVRRAAPRIRESLGKSGELLHRLIDLLAPNGEANLRDALTALYPHSDAQTALAQLRQLRFEIAQQAKKRNLAFALSGDKATRAQPEARKLWFEGDDAVMETTEAWQRAELGTPDWTVDLKAEPLNWAIYFEFADADRTGAEALIALLEPYCKADGIEIRDGRLLPGETDAVRQAARRGSRLIIPLLSPQFFAAKLGTHPSPASFPILLYSLPQDREVGYPFEIFRHNRKSFDKCAAASAKREFAVAAFEALKAKLSRPLDRALELRALAEHDVCYTDGSAAKVTLRRGGLPLETTNVRASVLDLLNDWLQDPGSPRYCVLFGELGMGKTTTAKQFTLNLWDRREHDPSLPIPLFLDLRYLGRATPNLTLDDILTRVLRGSWKGGPRAKAPDLDEVYRLAGQGALVIFDGLDEVLVHLSATDGQHFTRQLLGLAQGPNAPRLLLTCRSHFFGTFAEQSAHFITQRDGVKEDDYRALLLLPFNEQQIRAYLQNTLPVGEHERAFELLSQVHDLKGLAERPYLLALITGQFTQLEALKAAGRQVTSITLYRLFVEEWLLRDRDKHKLKPHHKQMLMEHIAAELLRSGQRTWSADGLDEWLMGFLVARPAVGGFYGAGTDDKEILREDLRTATFLVRDEAADQFRFAHTSLQEYFLACHLRRALEDAKAEEWALAGVSKETLDFLGQSLRESRSPLALAGLAAIRGAYRKDASELAFRYCLQAQGKYPAPSLAGFQLPGADLWELEIDHPGPELLDLTGVNLRGATLGNSFWRRCRLAGADFSGSDASRGQWEQCDLGGADWRGSNLEAAVFYECGESKSPAAVHLPERRNLPLSARLQVQLAYQSGANSVAWSPDGRRLASGSSNNTVEIWDPQTGRCVRSLLGHQDSVRSVAWSPDGRWLSSASADCTVKIWDPQAGQSILSLQGHQDSVVSAAWSPDGRWLASASWDLTAKIWDPQTGQCAISLLGHQDSVMSVAWSPDGRRLASASWDHTVKIWDLQTGQCALSLQGHQGPVWSIAWSPDGRRLASASSDDTVKIWDPQSGQCSLSLQGHQNAVRSVAWSPDGRRFGSASSDGTVKIWDPQTGQCTLSLQGHRFSVRSVAWSLDVNRLASASDDGTVKIWDTQTGQCALSHEGHQSFAMSVGWSPDGLRLASASTDETVKIWDAQTGQCGFSLLGHHDPVNSVAWSPDGLRLATASDDKTVRIWDAQTGQCALSLEGHRFSTLSVCWSPDGRRLASGSSDQTVKVWDGQTGQCVLSLEGHKFSTLSVCWSPDGLRLVSASDDQTMKIWDAQTGQCALSFFGHLDSVMSACWSPDGLSLASGSSDQMVKIWDVQTGQCALSLEGHQLSVRSVAWSPDGRRLASASWDHAVKIWNAKSGECLQTALSPIGFPGSISWRGPHLLLSGSDGFTILDANTLEEIGPRCHHLQAPHGKPTWVSLNPRTNTLLAHGEDAWRSVGYVIPDPDGHPRWHSIAAFAQHQPTQRQAME